MSALLRTVKVQMFMRDLKKMSALWRGSALKGFLRNSSGTNFFVRLREVSALEYVRFREVPLCNERTEHGDIDDNIKHDKNS